jgi:uncharacterized protein (TIGR01777 family)
MDTEKRVAIIGGTGTIGRATAQRLTEAGWLVRIISRNPERAKQEAPGFESYVELSVEGLEEIDAVINLAGAPLFGHIPTTSYKKTLRESRVGTTEKLVQILTELSNRPTVLIQGSAIGIYGSDRRHDEAQTEAAPLGTDFLAQLCTDWEAAAKPAEALGIRVVYFRSGLILDPHQEGLLEALTPPFKLYVGGVIGDPDSYKPWIHLDDETGLMLYVLTHTVSGPFNAVAPGVTTNREFFHALGAVLHRPCWFPVPEWLLTPLFREMATALCKGPRVVGTPSDYSYIHPELYETLTSIFSL